jgi:hypothetical protein
LITEKQATMIAHVLHEIRPSWAIDGTRKVLDRNKDHPAAFGELMSAAVTAALDPETQTPGRIYQVSIHWPPAAKARLPKPQPCPDHIGEASHSCRCCIADTKAGIRPQTHIGKHWQPQGIADQLEASHEAAPDEAVSVVEGDA